MRIRPYAAVFAVAAACITTHLALESMLASPGWRRTGLWLGGAMAFSVPVFREGDFLFPGQRIAMLFTYGFRHVGWMHLAMNMAMLVPLGMMLVRRAGPARFLTLYLLTMAGAAVLYGLFTAKAGAMVGASGGIHGLAGALVGMMIRDRQGDRAAVLLGVIALINAVFWWMLDGRFAWELHAAGMAIGLLLPLVLHRGSGRTQNAAP